MLHCSFHPGMICFMYYNLTNCTVFYPSSSPFTDAVSFLARCQTFCYTAHMCRCLLLILSQFYVHALVIVCWISPCGYVLHSFLLVDPDPVIPCWCLKIMIRCPVHAWVIIQVLIYTMCGRTLSPNKSLSIGHSKWIHPLLPHLRRS